MAVFSLMWTIILCVNVLRDLVSVKSFLIHVVFCMVATLHPGGVDEGHSISLFQTKMLTILFIRSK